MNSAILSHTATGGARLWPIAGPFSLDDESAYAPWREEAVKRGYAASIALPLKTDSQVLGALNIYASESDAFDADETALLVELAEDLAFGIVASRNRQRQMQAEQDLMLAGEVFENSVEGIMIADAETRLVLVNKAPSAASFTKETIEGLLKRDLAGVITPAPELAFQSTEQGQPMVVLQPTSLATQQVQAVANHLAQV